MQAIQLEAGRPDLAIPCKLSGFSSYRKTVRIASQLWVCFFQNGLKKKKEKQETKERKKKKRTEKKIEKENNLEGSSVILAAIYAYWLSTLWG